MAKQSPESKKRAAIYCRVSTHEQGKGDFSSLDSQEKILREFCKSRNWAVSDVYSDTKTGSTLDRDDLNRLMKDAEEGKFDVITITKVDRISRSIRNFYELDTRLEALGIGVAVATQQFDTTTPAGKMMRNLLLTFAEFERDVIGDRTREKLYSQAKNGQWGGGLVMLGYDVMDKKLIVNEEEAKLVRRIFQYYLEEPSSNQVAKRLNKEGYKTKSRKTKSDELSGGGPFNNQVIKLLLKNKVYIGTLTYKGEEFKGLHEPIVDLDTFNEVQKAIAKAAIRKSNPSSESDLILLGLTKCGFCGKNLTTTYGKGRNEERYYYYKCSSKSKFGSEKCESADYPAQKLEALVEQVIVHLGEDEQFFNAVFKQMTANENVELKRIRESLADLKSNLASNERQTKQLVRFIATSGDKASNEPIQEQLEEYYAEKSMLLRQIAELERQIEITTTYDISKKQLRERYKGLAEVYGGLPLEKKKKLTNILVTEIECFLKKKETKGLLKFNLRGDRTLDFDFKTKQELETGVSSSWFGWLRR